MNAKPKPTAPKKVGPLSTTAPATGEVADLEILKTPASFLRVAVRKLEASPQTLALCAGYEAGKWRCESFAWHIIQWLPEFCLTYSERKDFGTHNALERIKRAAHKVYTSDKYGTRGEFGEVILHAVVRQEFGSIPAISKIYYKDSSNDTVKGFDLVHIVPNGADLSLWLGEAKLYKDPIEAIKSVVEDLNSHFTPTFMRSEFVFVTDKVDRSWPYAPKLLQLLSENTSLDEVFNRLYVPVLIGYESPTTRKHTQHSDMYFSELTAEAETLRSKLVSLGYPSDLTVVLLLLPIADKDALLHELHQELRTWQRRR